MFFFQDKTNVTPVTHSGFWLRRVQAKPVVSLNRHRRSWGGWFRVVNHFSIFFRTPAHAWKKEKSRTRSATFQRCPTRPDHRATPQRILWYVLFLGVGWGGGLSFLPRFISFFSSCLVLREHLGEHVQSLRTDAPLFFYRKNPKK
jgi:hypothetical protein